MTSALLLTAAVLIVALSKVEAHLRRLKASHEELKTSHEELLGLVGYMLKSPAVACPHGVPHALSCEDCVHATTTAVAPFQ